MCLWIGLFPYDLAFNDFRIAMLRHLCMSVRLTHQGLLTVHGPTQQETELSELWDPIVSSTGLEVSSSFLKEQS